MSFELTKFMAKAGLGGVLRDNKFTVEILTIPPALRANYSQIRDDLTFYAERASLPGLRIDTNDVRRFGIGVEEKKPYTAAFIPLGLSFRCDPDAVVVEFMHDWQRCVVDFQNRDGVGVTSGILGGSQTPFEIGYKRDYAVNVRVTAYADDGHPATAIVFREAFPTFVGGTDLAWESRGGYYTFSAILTYFDWYQARVPPRT